MVDQQQVLRLQALFKSGRDKLQSFFAVLNEVRLEIGDQALPSWCFNELHIGFSVVDNIAKVLVKTDEERIKNRTSRSKNSPTGSARAGRPPASTRSRGSQKKIGGRTS